MRPMDGAVLMHNALASTTAAYGASLQDIAQELAAANATVSELKKMLEALTKRNEMLEAERDAKAPKPA